MSTEPTEQTRATRPHGDARRRQILDTALELFAAHGFNKVSVAEIASQVGITQAGLLHHFPTKAALLLAVLQEREERNLADRARLEGAHARPLDAYLQTLHDNDRQPALVQLFVLLSAESTSESHPGHAWFVERNRTLVEQMEERVRSEIDEDLLPDGIDAAVVTRWLLGLAHGLGAMWVLDTGAFDRAGHVDLFLRMLEPFRRERPVELPPT